MNLITKHARPIPRTVMLYHKFRSLPHLSEPDERDERDGRYICTRSALFSLWFLFMFVHDLSPPSYVSPSAAPTPELLRLRVCEAQGGCPACPVSRSSGRLQQEPGRLLAATVRARVWSPSVDVARGGDGTSLGGASRGGSGRGGRPGLADQHALRLLSLSSLARPPRTPQHRGQRLSASLAFPTSRQGEWAYGRQGETEG